MTICAFKDEAHVKCKRTAVSSYHGKPFCNKHLQELRRLEFDNIDFEKAEQDLNLHKGGSS